jgi:hypothetical protein
MGYQEEPKWSQAEPLHPDDYTISEQDRQRLQLIEDLKQKKMLDRRLSKILKSREAVGEGWLRPTVRGYHEGELGLAEVVAEVEGSN